MDLTTIRHPGFRWNRFRFGPNPGVSESYKKKLDQRNVLDKVSYNEQIKTELNSEERKCLMSSERERRKTYQGFRDEALWEIDLAEDGFYCADLLAGKHVCGICDGIVKGLKKDEDPIKLHREHFGYCSIVLKKPCNNTTVQQYGHPDSFFDLMLPSICPITEMENPLAGMIENGKVNADIFFEKIVDACFLQDADLAKTALSQKDQLLKAEITDDQVIQWCQENIDTANNPGLPALLSETEKYFHEGNAFTNAADLDSKYSNKRMFTFSRLCSKKDEVIYFLSKDLKDICIPGNHRGCTHNMVKFDGRLNRLEQMDFNCPVSNKLLAEAGFFCNQPDKTKCFACGGELHAWQEGDDPWREHAKWHPSCVFVQLKKGARFVREAVFTLTAEEKAAARFSYRGSPELSVLDFYKAEPFDVQTSPKYRILVDMGLRGDLIRMAFELNEGKDFESMQDLISEVLKLEDKENRRAEGEAEAPLEPLLDLKQFISDEDNKAYKKGYSLGEYKQFMRMIEQAMKCVLCGEREIQSVAIPCGHLSYCKVCSYGELPEECWYKNCKRKVIGAVRFIQV